MNEQNNWMNGVTKAAFTVLIVAFVAFVAWTLLHALIVPLVVLLVMLWIYRLALGLFRRDGW